MAHKIWTTMLLSLMVILPPVISAQNRGTPVPNTQVPKPPQPQTKPPQQQTGKRGVAPKVQPPLTLKEVIQSLLSLRNSSKVESLVSVRGIQFQSSPTVLDILKEFGAGPRLLSMISAASTPAPEPDASKNAASVNKVAGPLSILCEPRDCVVSVDAYRGQTEQKRLTVTGLKPGDVVVHAFADGYEAISQKIQLEEGKPFEATFRLKRTEFSRQQAASVSMLKTIAALGGTDGMASFGDIEGKGVVNWTDNTGKVQEWPMTFKKRIGNDLAITFKTKDGQCTASINGRSAKQDCRGDLRGSGEKIAEQATSLFLSYQLQDVTQALMNRTLIASENTDDRLESPGTPDAYLLNLGPDSLPVDLIYRSAPGEQEVPIQVQYSNYMTVNNRGRYPGRVAIGRLNAAPVFVFTIMDVRSNVALTQK